MKPKAKITNVEIFLDELSKKGLPIELIGEYKGSSKKTTFQCKTCGYEWEAQPYTVLRYKGLGCLKCRDKDQGKRLRKSHNQYIRELSTVNPNIEPIENYQTSQTKILHKCKICGYEWYVTPHSLLHNSGCPKCANRVPITHISFLNSLPINIKNNLDILGEYEGADIPILCKCKICGFEFTTIPARLRCGNGCKKCADKLRGIALRKTHDQFVEELKQVNSDIEIIGEYITSKDPIECRCKKCGNIWTPCASSLLSGFGCPHCLMPHGERDIEKYLQDNNIFYESQKKFPNLYGRKMKLSYDFYLPDYNLLIEFQGEQHERPIDLFGGEQTFIIQKERDEKKRKYASDHNIDLLEIWYYDQKNISTILDNYLQSKSVETVIPPVAI